MKVIRSLAEPHGARCVDILQCEDGSFVFKEFRRDPEDGGRWTLLADYSRSAFSTHEAALSAAAAALPWLGRVLG
jgi:hypothetical protein